MGNHNNCSGCGKPTCSSSCPKRNVRAETMKVLNCPLDPTIDPNDYLNTYAMLPDKDTGVPQWYWSGYACDDGKGMPGNYNGWMPVGSGLMPQGITVTSGCELAVSYDENCTSFNVQSEGLAKMIQEKIEAELQPLRDTQIVQGDSIANNELCISDLKNSDGGMMG